MRKFFPQQLRGCVLSGTVALLAAAALFAGDAAAQTANPGDPTYLDDRSTAEAVIRSLYNAIDRGEYARAYGYFAEEGREPDYEAFAAGYRDTVGVEVLLGEAVAEGAAGSTYWKASARTRPGMRSFPICSEAPWRMTRWMSCCMFSAGRRSARRTAATASLAR